MGCSTGCGIRTELSEIDLEYQGRSTGQINGHPGQGFIHGHCSITVTLDPNLVTQRFVHRLAKHDTDVLDAMVAVDMSVPRCFDIQPKPAMTCNVIEHVIK